MLSLKSWGRGWGVRGEGKHAKILNLKVEKWVGVGGGGGRQTQAYFCPQEFETFGKMTHFQ